MIIKKIRYIIRETKKKNKDLEKDVINIIFKYLKF